MRGTGGGILGAMVLSPCLGHAHQVRFVTFMVNKRWLYLIRWTLHCNLRSIWGWYLLVLGGVAFSWLYWMKFMPFLIKTWFLETSMVYDPKKKERHYLVTSLTAANLHHALFRYICIFHLRRLPFIDTHYSLICTIF